MLAMCNQKTTRGPVMKNPHTVHFYGYNHFVLTDIKLYIKSHPC